MSVEPWTWQVSLDCRGSPHCAPPDPRQGPEATPALGGAPGPEMCPAPSPSLGPSAATPSSIWPVSAGATWRGASWQAGP